MLPYQRTSTTSGANVRRTCPRNVQRLVSQVTSFSRFGRWHLHVRGTIGVSGSRDSDREHALVICRACLTHRISFVFSGVSIRKQKNTIITTHSAFFIIHVSVMIHHQPSKRRHNAWLFAIQSITCINARTSYIYKRPSLDVQPLYVR